MIVSFIRQLELDFEDSFRGRALMWQGIAIVTTTAIVLSGLDWRYYEATRSQMLFGFVLFAGLGGFVVPVFAPALLFLFGLLRKQKNVVELGLLIARSEMTAYLISIIYKAFTGRFQPNLATGFDISREFHFGILQNGIFWGWPSSHTAVAFAGAIVLALSVRNPVVRALAVLYAFLIGFGASVGFHWLSDVVAGAIIGTAVAHVAYLNSKKSLSVAFTVS